MSFALQFYDWRDGKPWCFKNTDIKPPPPRLEIYKKAWMAFHIMEEWLRAFTLLKTEFLLNNNVTCKSNARQRPQHTQSQTILEQCSLCVHGDIIQQWIEVTWHVFCKSSRHANGLAGYRTHDTCFLWCVSMLHLYKWAEFLSRSSKQQKQAVSLRRTESTRSWPVKT
jgi:hypothetical protein